MQPEPSTGGHRRRFAWGLALLVGLGLALRVAFVMAHQGPTDSPFLVGGDGADYHMLADNLADGRGYISGFDLSTSGRPPAWPFVLAAASTLRESALFTQQIAAAIIGTLTVLLVGLAGRRLAGPGVGLVAAAIAAVYPGFWVYEWPLLSETLLLPVMALTLLFVYRFRDRPTVWRAIGLGALTALLALTRSEQLLAGVLVVAPVILLARQVAVGRRVAWLAAAGATTVALLVPWIVYNNSRFEEPVYLSTGLGNTLLAGNCEGTYSGELYGLYDTRCNFFLPIPAESDLSETDIVRREAAIDFMSDHLGELPAVALAREGRVLGVYRFEQTTERWSDWSNSPVWVVRSWLIASWVLLVVAIYGIVALRRRSIPVYPLLGFTAITVVSIGLTIGEVRYRAGLEVPLVLLAAVGLTTVVDRWRASRRGGEDPSEELGAHEPADLSRLAEVPGSG